MRVVDEPDLRDGRILCSDFSHQTDLYLQSLDGGDARRLTFHTQSNFGARISPDGKRVAYNSDRTGSDEIWVLDLASGKERRITSNDAEDRAPSWSADSRRLVFVSDRTGKASLFTADIEGGAAQPIANTDGATLARWTPDGTAIGYVAVSDDGPALWRILSDGGTAEKVLDGVTEFEWYRSCRTGTRGPGTSGWSTSTPAR